jgi:hypothetical protein
MIFRTLCVPLLRTAQRSDLFLLKRGFGKSRLANNALQRPTPEFIVERHGDGNSRSLSFKLHYAMATTLPDDDKSVLFEDLADLTTRKDPQLTQRGPQPV